MEPYRLTDDIIINLDDMQDVIRHEKDDGARFLRITYRSGNSGQGTAAYIDIDCTHHEAERFWNYLVRRAASHQTYGEARCT